MNKKLYKERYKFYKEQLKKYKTKEEKIKYLENVLFLIQMIDIWDETEGQSFLAVKDLLNKLKK